MVLSPRVHALRSWWTVRQQRAGHLHRSLDATVRLVVVKNALFRTMSPSPGRPPDRATRQRLNAAKHVFSRVASTVAPAISLEGHRIRELREVRIAVPVGR